MSVLHCTASPLLVIQGALQCQTKHSVKFTASASACSALRGRAPVRRPCAAANTCPAGLPLAAPHMQPQVCGCRKPCWQAACPSSSRCASCCAVLCCAMLRHAVLCHARCRACPSAACPSAACPSAPNVVCLQPSGAGCCSAASCTQLLVPPRHIKPCPSLAPFCLMLSKLRPAVCTPAAHCFRSGRHSAAPHLAHNHNTSSLLSAAPWAPQPSPPASCRSTWPSLSKAP